jgi:hypothetical protein
MRIALIICCHHPAGRYADAGAKWNDPIKRLTQEALWDPTTRDTASEVCPLLLQGSHSSYDDARAPISSRLANLGMRHTASTADMSKYEITRAAGFNAWR